MPSERKQKIIVLGNGFVANHLNYKIIKERLQASEEQIEKIIDRYHPDVIINTIGRTGKANIDDCEKQKAETVISNLTIPTILGKLTEQKNIQLIHIGSGCIFYGNSPRAKIIDPHNQIISDTGWEETDFAHPLSFYSKTKYAADLMLSELKNTTILRIRMPISGINHPRNLISKLVKYEKVIDQLNSVTFVEDIKNAVEWIIENNKNGIYHLANPQPIKHSFILDEYCKYFPDHKYSKISEKDLQKLVIAPRSNCILNVNKIQNEGFNFTDISTRTRECVKNFVQDLKNRK